MRRFFFDPAKLSGEHVVITGQEARHMTTVLRLAPASRIELFDGQGSILLGEILSTRPDEVRIRILSGKSVPEHASPLTLCQAMLKGKKMDGLVQKATELGVHTFQPLITRYCEKRKFSQKQLQRWERIMLEACKQCGRPLPMHIASPLNFTQLHPFTNSSCIVPWEDEQTRPLSPSLLPATSPTVLLIGPEGGFHISEIKQAQDLGFTTVSLGQRTLRAETAALTAVSIVQYVTGNISPSSAP